VWGIEHSCHYRKKARSKDTTDDLELLPTPSPASSAACGQASSTATDMTQRSLHKLTVLYLTVRTVQQEGISTVPDGKDSEAGR